MGDGQRTLCTKFGEINFCESFSHGDMTSCWSFFISSGSLKVVRLSVFGGVGLGCRGKDEANVDVVPVFVGDEFSTKTNELHELYNIIF